MNVGNRMREIFERSGMTQQELADKMGIDRTTLIYYFNHPTAPKRYRLEQFCRAVNCTVDEVMTAKPGIYQIPVYGTIAAGIPTEAIENIIGYEEVPAAEYQDACDYFALQLKGMSMYPRMQSGDVVIFRKQDCADSGDIVAVSVGTDDATCKQIFISEDGITLHALNESFGDMRFTRQQVASFPITIIGKAVELRAKFA